MKRQRGVALIIALILVALATILASKLTFDGFLERRRAMSGPTSEVPRVPLSRARLDRIIAALRRAGEMRLVRSAGTREATNADNPSAAARSIGG
jgi:hypothetical protein